MKIPGRIIVLISILILIIFISINIVNISDDSLDRIVLDGMWKTSLDDSTSFKEKDYDDKNWEEAKFIYNNVSIKRDYDKIDKIIWFRKDFFMGKDLDSKDLMLYIPRLPNYHDVYFNGSLIGKTISTPEKIFSDWNRKYGYFIPKNLIEYGSSNNISIRTYSNFEYGPSGNLTIERAEKILRRINIYNSSYTYIYLSNMIILLGASAYFYFIYTRMEKKKFLYFSCLCFVTALYYTNHFVSVLPISYLLFQKIVMSCMFLIPIFGVLFLREFLSLPLMKFQKANMAIRVIIIGLSVVLFKDLISYNNFRKYFFIVFALDFVYIFCMVVNDHLKKRIWIRGLTPFIIIVLLMCGHDIYHEIRGTVSPIGFQLNVYGLMCFIGVVAMDLAREYIELYTKASLDGLTGLFTQSYFKNELIEIVKHKEKLKKELSVMMLDIDKFKVFNDTYGHLMGDEVLKIVAKIIKDTVAKDTIVTRYGGEEFAIILKDYGEEESIALGEKIRRNIEDFRLKVSEDTNIKVTISIGITTFVPQRILLHSEILIEEADRALYYSKENGRNKVTHHRKIRYPKPD